MTRETTAQAASAVLMIRPAAFGTNPQTRASNHFQAPGAQAGDAAHRARAEFDGLADTLEAYGVEVHRFPGRHEEALPDEVFPNNWLSLHADGTAVLYPLMAPNRRGERRRDVLEALGERFVLRRVLDLSPLERRGEFVEGTGSLVLDRAARTAYACRSPRTSAAAAEEAARTLGYETVLFDAFDRAGRAVYHTNVMMSVGSGFAIVASAAIRDRGQRRRVLERLEADGREAIEITLAQMHAFAGNAIELHGARGPLVALSRRALESLDPARRRRLERHAELVAADVTTVETLGGGSVRCMLAEIHLPRR